MTGGRMCVYQLPPAGAPYYFNRCILEISGMNNGGGSAAKSFFFFKYFGFMMAECTRSGVVTR